MSENRTDLNASHRDHHGDDPGAAGQHIELERLIAYYEGRTTAAEGEELVEHLMRCGQCQSLSEEFNLFANASGKRGVIGPEYLEQEAWEALQRRRSSVRKEPAFQTVAATERRVSWFRSVQRFFTETSAGLLRAVLRPFARGQRAVRLKITPKHADRGIRPSSVDVSFEEFLKDVEPRLKRLLADYHIPIDDREDIVQQALLALLYQWERIRQPEAWLFGAIKRHCLVYWRVRRQDRQNEKPEAMEDSSNQKAEDQIDFDDSLLAISPPEEEILRYLRRVARGIVAAA